MPPKARRRRGGRRDNRNRGPKGPPQTPQLKITVRNVHSFPTCRLMGDNLMRGLIGRANSLLEQQYKMVLEETSLMMAIEAEEAALEKRKAWEKEQEAKHGGSKEEEEVDGEQKEETEADNGKETSQEDTVKPPTAAAATTAKPEGETIVQGMENLAIAADDTVIKVRVLYMVPSKQTRRRGEKPGYTSLLLMAPPIANKNPPPPPQPKVAAPDETAASLAEAKEEPKPQEASNANGDTPVVKDQAKVETPPPQVVVDYSSDIARRRLMLQRSLDALVQAAQQDGGATYQVEESPSAKTFRISNRRDRLEGTLQDSPDYKQFFSKTQQAQEERKARPKPAPGGSLLVMDGLPSSTTTTSTSLQQQPVAAIVLHLQQKKQEELRKKSKKKRGNKTNNTNKVATVENKGGGRKKRNKKKPAGG